MSLHPDGRIQIEEWLRSHRPLDRYREQKTKIELYTLTVITELYDENGDYIETLATENADDEDDVYTAGELESMARVAKINIVEANTEHENVKAQVSEDNEYTNYPDWSYLDCHTYVEYRSFNSAIIYVQIMCKPMQHES